MRNKVIAKIMAMHFLAHLKKELLKSSSLLDEVSINGRTHREIIEKLIAKLNRHFKGLNDILLESDSLFEDWVRLSGFLRYEDNVFDSFDIMLFARILDMNYNDIKSKRFLRKTIFQVLSKFNYGKSGLSIAFFLDAENSMKDILLKHAKSQMNDFSNKDLALITSQSRFFQICIYEFFEGLISNLYKNSTKLKTRIYGSALENIDAEKDIYKEDASVVVAEICLDENIRADLDKYYEIVNLCFSSFDDIINKNGLDKINAFDKTYVCASLTAKEPVVSAIDASLAVIEMADAVALHSAEMMCRGLSVRIGIHCGDLVLKKIGKSKRTSQILGEGYFTANCLKNLADDFEIAASSMLKSKISAYFDFEEWDLSKWCTLKGIKEGLFILNDKTKPNEIFYEELASGF